MKLSRVFLVSIATLLISNVHYIEGAIKVEKKQIINGRMFADERNTSYLPFTIKLNGEVIWPKNSEVVGLLPNSIPFQLFILDDFLYVGYNNSLQCLKKGTGEQVWTKPLFKCSWHALDPSGFITVTPANYLERIDLFGKIVSSNMLIGMTTNSSLVWVREKDGIISFVMNSSGNKYAGPGIPKIPPSMMYYRNDKKREQVLFNFARVNDMAKTVCVSGNDKQLYVACSNVICEIPFDVKDSESINEIIIDSILQMSLTHDDALLIVTLHDDMVFLQQMKVAGKTDWSIELDRKGSLWQPPASTPDGHIFLTLGTTLYAIKDGKKMWTAELPNMGGKIFITALADNSLLVQCSHWIAHFSSEGKILIEKTIVGELTCRPIVDEKGNLYIGGKGGISCLR